MNTLKQTLFLLLVLVFAGVSKTIAQSTGVYVGGHIRRERPGTIEKLRNSGFTYIILFNINVESDGTLTTDGETVCKDGKYVFGNTQPNYVSDIKKLKQAPTTISRIEICIGGWGNESFSRIKELINSHGVGSGTILYKNFKALKNAIPEIDAVNNDDEQCYDVATAVKFHQMMYDLGYKTTIAPYTNRSFWENLVSQLGDRCDRVLIQCYDGGAGNNPSDWHFGNRAVHAGRMNYQEGGVDACVAQMESWKKNNGVSGGFIWIYNDETWNLNQWATRMLRVFGTKKCDDCIASLYADSDYRGYSTSLGEGSYTQADLAMYGISAKDISSLKVTKGFKITLYENADFTGNSKSWTADASFVGGDWNDKACSVRIEPNGKSGLSGNFKIMNRNSGKYLDLDNNKTDNNTAIVQFDDEGVDASQTWTFTEVMKGKGVYSICSYGNKNRGMDVVDFSKDNGAQVQLYDYLGNPHQQFILYDCGEGYYQLVARNSGKVVEIPQSSKGNGEWIKIYDNNGTYTQQWAVVENRYDEASAVTLYTDADYKGKAVTLSEGKYDLSRMGLYNLKDNDMSSLKVTPGFKVTIYEDDNFNGKSKSYTASESSVGEEWNDKMSSLEVEACGKSGLSGNFKIMNRNSGKYLDLDNNKTDNNTAIVQFDDEGVDASQTWTFTEVMKGKGVYSICSYGNKNRGMDVVDFSKDNGAQVQLYDYLGNPHQQFILYDCGEGYYQLVARNSGKVVEIPQSSKGNGEWIKIYDNNGTYTQQWAVVENRYDEASAVTLYTDADYKGKAVTLSEGKYDLSRMGLYNLKDNDMSSLKVTPGFKVTIYEDDNFNGKSKSYTASESSVGEEWNDKMSSLVVEAYGKSGLSGNFKIMNRNSGKFLDLDNNNTDNNTAIVQYDDEGIDATQIWTLTEIGGEKGVYSICTSVNKRQGMDVVDWSKDDGAQVQLYEYLGNRNQQFIVVENGDGYYQFVSRLSGKVIEIPNSSKDNGEWIKLYDNNGTNTQQWKFVSPSVYSGIVNTESLSGMNLRKEGNTIIVTGAKGKELTIYDVSGRLIRCETIDSAKYSMSLDKMKAGIYIMKIDSIAKKIRVEL